MNERTVHIALRPVCCPGQPLASRLPRDQLNPARKSTGPPRKHSGLYGARSSADPEETQPKSRELNFVAPY